MPEMQWHDSVLVELRRTRQAVEKLAELLEKAAQPPVMKVPPRAELPAEISVGGSSYIDWRREALMEQRASQEHMLDQPIGSK